jgi:hypothetical protein
MMQEERLIEFATSRRGTGWLGAMEIIDAIDTASISSERKTEIKLAMQVEIGQQILSESLGSDEFAVAMACNQCIENVVEKLNAECLVVAQQS